MRRSHNIKSVDADSVYNQAIILIQNGDFSDAKLHAKKLLKLDSSDARHAFLLGIIAIQEGKHDTACKHLLNAVRGSNLDSGYHYHLGIALTNQNSVKHAIAAYEKTIELKPDFLQAHNNLSSLYLQEHQPEKALVTCTNALNIRPGYTDIYNNYANALSATGRHHEALAAFNKAIQLQPENSGLYYNRGLVLELLHQYESATESYQCAIQLDPGLAEAYCNLGVSWIAAGKIVEAEKSYIRALELKPDYTKVRSNLLFTLNYRTDITPKEVFKAHRNWGQFYGAETNTSVYLKSNKAGEKLRIGYVSPDFRNHSVAFFFRPLIENHNRSSFEIFCYSNAQKNDPVTDAIRIESDHWRDIYHLDDMQVTKQIKDDGIDILIDLAGHTNGNRLAVFALKPAPIQVTWLGYPNTTGLKTMDYRLTDEISDPPGCNDEFYVEELVRLGNGFLCYQPLSSAPEIVSAPCMKNGYVTFGSFNTMPKINQECISAWSRILANVTDSHLIIKNIALTEDSVRRRILEQFSHHGIDKSRIELHGRVKQQAAHLALYNDIDITLDTSPYNGTTTTCEALWMGTPVVTLAGMGHSSRVSASILSAIGHTEWIFRSWDEYIDCTTNLAGDVHHLAHIRENLRREMSSSPLLDARAFALDMEECYRRIWDKYVAR